MGAAPRSLSGRLVLPEGVVRGCLSFDPDTGLIDDLRPGAERGDVHADDRHLVFPGFVDLHVHAREDQTGQETRKECYATAAAAALHGGVTCYADMPNTPLPAADAATWQAKRVLADRSPVHVVLHAAIGPDTQPLPFPVPYKVFLGPSVGGLRFASAGDLDRALARYRGRAVAFHCEDPAVLDMNKGAATHEARRPPGAEVSAVRQAVDLVRRHGLAGRICHVSTAEGLRVVEEARREGLDLACEVAPHHLFFDTDGPACPRRDWLRMNPPLRAPADRQALLDGLRRGAVDVLATDHAPHLAADKDAGTSGVPHLDTVGAFACWLMAAAGVPPERVLEVACAAPGRLLRPFLPESFGHGVGRLAPGWRADLAVLDLSATWTPQAGDIRSRCGWSPFEGLPLPGRVAQAWLGGRLQA